MILTIAIAQICQMSRLLLHIGAQGRHDSSYTVDNFEFLRAIPFQRPQPYAKADDEKPV